MKLFVLSDIHSFYDPMMKALNDKEFEIDNPDHHIVICGDLFDRGPDAVKVFEFMKDIADRGRLIYICGNHEELFYDCLNEILNKKCPGSHHISNGTLDTIIQFTGIGKYDLCGGFYNRTRLAEAIQPVIDFFSDNCVDFAEAGDYVFVHGWIPCNPYNGRVDENWRDGDWDEARWINGMSAWHKGAHIPGKTIVCGHYHSSWGHSHIHQDRKEFPQKNRVDWEKSFEPFVDEGIIAIDACTAYTGFCNCVVLEV